jgi:two-component system, response regulator PdtaR
MDNINYMSKRILIVEDEGILRVGTTLQLMSLGYEVVGHFQSGEEAIRHVNELNPDLILMDIKLAGEMNGIETVKEIQKLITVPVVYLSAFSDNELIEEAETTNPFRYLIKPLDEIELKFTIETAIDLYEKEQKSEIQDNVLDNLNGILYRFHVKDRKLIYINGLFEKITGYNQDELKSLDGHFLGEFILHDDQETVNKTINNSLDLNKHYIVDYRIKNKHNEINYFHEIGKPVIAKDNEVTYIDGIIFDLKTID